MTETPSRLAWLTRLVGHDKAKEVVADTHQAADLLDGAGVERKEMTGNTSPQASDQPTPPTEGDMVSEVGAKLAQQIVDAAQGDLSKLTVEELATIITDALRPAVEAESSAEDAASNEEPDTTMEDNNKAAAVPQEETSKALSDLLGQMLKDQGDMAKAFAQQATKIAQLEAALEATKSLKPAVDELVTTVDALRDKLNDRPRQASATDETALALDSESEKALEDAIKKGLQGPEIRFLGIPVKNTPK